MNKPYLVYIVKCNDGTLYTGVTNNLDQRIHAHNHLATGAKYTRNRRPVAVVYTEPCEDKSHACKRESAIKKLSRNEKLELIAQ